MARKSRGERLVRGKPAEKGAGDPLLGELREALDRPVPSKEASPVAEPTIATSVEPTAPTTPPPASVEAEPAASPSPENELTHGVLEDGARWEIREGKITIIRKREVGQTGKHTDVEYTSTLPEAGQIMTQQREYKEKTIRDTARAGESAVSTTATPEPVPPGSAAVPTEVASKDASVPIGAKGEKEPRRSRQKVKESFDPRKDYWGGVKDAYQELGETLRKMGIDPNELPPEVWKAANATLEKAKGLAQEYEKEPPEGNGVSPSVRKFDIAGEIYKAKTALSGGRVSKRIMEAAQKLKDSRGEAVSTASVSTPPTTGQVSDTASAVEKLEVTKKRLQEEAAEDIRRSVAARASARPSVVDPDAPTTKISIPVEPLAPAISSEAQRLEIAERVKERTAEVAEMLKGQDFSSKFWGGENPLSVAEVYVAYGRHERALEVLDEAARAIESGVPLAQEPIPTGIDFVPPASVEPTTELDDRIEPTLDAEPVPIEDTSPMPDDTRKGWYDTLRKLIEGAKNTFNKAKEFLTSEDTALSEKAKILGKGTEKLLLDVGERYRKLPLKYKIALSAALIGGSVATGGAGTFVTVLSAAKLGQRSASSLGVYTLVNGLMEKRLANREARGVARDKWDNMIKQFVSGGAALAVFSGLPGYALKEGFEAAGGDRLVGWLGNTFGHHAAVPGTTTPPAAEGHSGHETKNFAPKGTPNPIAPDRGAPTATPDIQPPEAPHPATAPAAGNAAPAPEAHTPQAPAPAATEAASAPAPETSAAAPAPAPAAATAPAIEMPIVNASSHGYEGMIKDLLKHLPDTKPANIQDGSDLAKLYEARASTDPKEIGREIHRIAMDNKHEFFTAKGNFRVDVGAHMTADADGNILFNGEVHAPTDAHFTPAYHPEAPTATATETPAIPESLRGIAPADYPAPEVPHLESAPVPEDALSAPESAPPVLDAVASHPLAAGQPLVWHTGSEGTLVDSSGNAVHAGVSEAVPGTNSFGLAVPDAVPHIYADPNADHLFAYGGSVAERAKMITEYLTKDPGKIVFAADETGKFRVPWHLVEGKAVAGPPMRTNGVLGFFSTHLKPPAPEEFQKVIK